MKKRITVSLPMDTKTTYTLAELGDLNGTVSAVSFAEQIIYRTASELSTEQLRVQLKQNNIGAVVEDGCYDYGNNTLLTIKVPVNVLRMFNKEYYGSGARIEFAIPSNGDPIKAPVRKNKTIIEYINTVLLPVLNNFGWMAVHSTHKKQLEGSMRFGRSGRESSDTRYHIDTVVSLLTGKLPNATVQWNSVDNRLTIGYETELYTKLTTPSNIKDRIITEYIDLVIQRAYNAYQYRAYQNRKIITTCLMHDDTDNKPSIVFNDQYQLALYDKILASLDNGGILNNSTINQIMLVHGSVHGIPDPDFFAVVIDEKMFYGIVPDDFDEILRSKVAQSVLNDMYHINYAYQWLIDNDAKDGIVTTVEDVI